MANVMASVMARRLAKQSWLTSGKPSWRELDRKRARNTKQIVARLPDGDEAG